LAVSTLPALYHRSPSGEERTGQSVLSHWVEEGLMLRRRIETSSWSLGDWLIAGAQWDRKFERSTQITGYSAEHLYNLRRVAEAFPQDVRSFNLSFAAHLMLLSEPDVVKRMELHAKAVAERWTVDNLRNHFREFPPTTRPIREASRHQLARVKCPCCGEVFEVKGNKFV
jgi:hypothetical protein